MSRQARVEVGHVVQVVLLRLLSIAKQIKQSSNQVISGTAVEELRTTIKAVKLARQDGIEGIRARETLRRSYDSAQRRADNQASMNKR